MIDTATSGVFGIAQQERQYELNEQSADNAMNRHLQIYHEINSPKAQVEALKEAGLNPAYVLSNGGLQGSGNIAPQGKGVDQMALLPSGGIMQMALYNAQIKREEAAANRDNAEAESLRGEKGTIGESTINLNNSQAETEEAKQAVLKEEQYEKELTNYINTTTRDVQIKQIQDTAINLERQNELLYWQAADGKLTYDFNSETYDKRVQQIEKTLSKTISETNLNNAQKRKLEKETSLLVKWYNLEALKLQWDNYNKEQERLNTKQIEKMKKDAEYKIQQMLAKYHLTEVQLQSVTQVLTSLIHATGLYTAGGYAQKLRSADKKADAQAEYERRRNIVLYGEEQNPYETELELLR